MGWREAGQREAETSSDDEEAERNDDAPASLSDMAIWTCVSPQSWVVVLVGSWQSLRPWLQHNHSPEISTLTLTKHRPNAELKTLNAKPEQAMQTQTVFHQAKLRVGELDDGTTVLEEQDVVYTERRIVWNPRQEEMGDKEVQNFAGEKGSSYDVRNGAGGDLEGWPYFSEEVALCMHVHLKARTNFSYVIGVPYGRGKIKIW